MALGKEKKKFVINAAIIIVVAALTFFYLFRSGVLSPATLSAIPIFGFMACFLLFLFALAINAVTELLIYRTFTKEINFKRSFFTVVFGNFGSGITPFRSGHFPLMAYYHYKSGVSGLVTVTGFMKCQIIYSAVSIVVYLAAYIYLAATGLTADIAGTVVPLRTAAAIGFAFHAAVFFLVIFLAFSARFQRAALGFICAVMGKFRKNFDREKFIGKQTEQLNRFKEQISIVGKSVYKYIAPAALYALYMAVMGSFQHVAYLFMSGDTWTAAGFFSFYILNLVSTYIANVVPLPGGVGTAEVLFVLVFANVIPDALLGGTLVLWRASAYYLPVILEFFVFMFFSLKKRKAALR